VGAGRDRPVWHPAKLRADPRIPLDGKLVVLAVSKDQVKDAPNIDSDKQLSDSEQDALRQHYSGYLGTAEQTSD
jgi:hypothetical protein